MKRLAQLVVTAVIVTIPVTASAQTLTEAQARAVITPWYVLFNQPVQGDMRTLQEQVLTADYESCWGYLPGECWGREASIKVVGGFAKSIPNIDRKSTRLNSSHSQISYAVFCLKKKKDRQPSS